MKRVAVVEYLMSAGGVERVLRGLARAFLEIEEAQHWDVTFLLSRYNSAHARCDWPAELTGPRVHVEWLGERSEISRALDRLAHGRGFRGIKVSRIATYGSVKVLRSLGPLRWRAMLGDAYALVAEESKRFDLMYFTYPFWMGVPPMDVPVVTTPQDFNFKHFLEEGSWARRVQERSARAWLDRADRLLLSSHFVGGELKTWYPEFVPKSQVVHLGIGVTRDVPPAEAIRAVRDAHRLPQDFVLVSGWVMPHKNQLAVVEAMKLLREKGIPVPFVFVGPNTAALAGGPSPGLKRSYVEDVRDALGRAGFEPGRDFFGLGYVSDAEIQALYRAATMFACPSLYEGFGLPGLEAMLAGCPVLLSAIPPFEEQNELLGGVVRTFDPNDPAALAAQIEWVISHRDEAVATARLAADRVVTTYDWRKTARQYLQAFDDVLAEHGRSSSRPLRSA